MQYSWTVNTVGNNHYSCVAAEVTSLAQAIWPDTLRNRFLLSFYKDGMLAFLIYLDIQSFEVPSISRERGKQLMPTVLGRFCQSGGPGRAAPIV